jgi:hypothetical protein
VTTEQQLGKLISARLPSLMEHVTVPRMLSVHPAALTSAPEPAASMPPVRAPAKDGPRQRTTLPAAAAWASILARPTWLAPVLVAVAALVAGVVLTLLFI